MAAVSKDAAAISISTSVRKFSIRRVARKNEMMSMVVQSMSDQDIEDLAVHYAAIVVTETLRARPFSVQGHLGL